MSRKGTKTETQPLAWEDAMMLLDRLRDRDNKTRLLLACGFYFGLRIGDTLSLTWKEVLQDHFHVTEKKTEKKNKKPRRITVNDKFKVIRDQFLESLNYTPPPEELLFFYDRKGADKTKPISVVAANKRIKKALESYRHNLQTDVSNPSSHTLRKTFGRRVYENSGCSEDALVKLSEVFNHSNVAITRRYIGLTAKEIEDIYLTL